MTLLDYEEARGWAPMIAEVVGNGRMPPWHADPRYGDFVNARRLTETDKAVLIRWAESGAAEGEQPDIQPGGSEAPGGTDSEEGWAIGTPDYVVQMPAPHPVQADGFMDYVHVRVDLGLKERSYQVLDAENAVTPVQTVEFTKVGTEALETTAGTYETLIIDTLNRITGLKTRIWLNVADGMVVKISLPNGVEVTLADPSVRERIKRVDVDDTIMAKAETDIAEMRQQAAADVEAAKAQAMSELRGEVSDIALGAAEMVIGTTSP